MVRKDTYIVGFDIDAEITNIVSCEDCNAMQSCGDVLVLSNPNSRFADLIGDVFVTFMRGNYCLSSDSSINRSLLRSCQQYLKI